MMETRNSYGLLLLALVLLFNGGFCQSVSLVPQPRFGFGLLSSLFGGGNKSLAGGQVCLTFNGLTGTCVDFFSCNSSVGTAGGKCGLGFKVCCLPVSPVSSGNLVRQNQETSDSLTITRISPAFCQVRVDFTVFNLDPVDTRNGGCTTGQWTATGQRDNNVPTLCGFNTGQHLYMNFDAAGTPITMNIATGLATANWNIQTMQIACYDQQNLAPAGCLQFFPNPSGNVRSFGYPNIIPAITSIVTFQLANLDYIVCIDRSTSTFNSITWTRDMTTLLSFTITGPTSVTGQANLGSVNAADFDATCTARDFVAILNGRFTNAAIQPQTANMFCGNGFPSPVVSTPQLKPFTLRVFTNGFERQPPIPIDFGNIGFSLNYVLS